MAQTAEAPSARLNSWKEIIFSWDVAFAPCSAGSMNSSCRYTRIGTGPRSPVFALVAELNFWVATSGARRTEAAHGAPPTSLKGKPLEDSHRLTSKIHTLVRAVAENSVRQRRQAEILEKRILEIRARMK